MPILRDTLESLSLSSTYDQSFGLNSQRTHRLDLFRLWLKQAEDNGYDLESSIIAKKTLDIGCGQGDMLEAFAAVLKAQGNKESSVIGVDPARLDYGTPYTLGQAQSGLLNGPLHNHLSFEQIAAPALVASQPAGTYSVAYFAHSLYYFPDSGTIEQNFKSLLDTGVTTLLLAEWSLSISRPAALPHLLAVLLQSIDPLPEGNVRTVLSPAAYIEVAARAGWEVVGSEIITPTEGLQDGKWEAGFAREVARKRRIAEEVAQWEAPRSEERIRLESLRAHADALENSMDERGVDGVECMDVWTAVLRLAGPTPEKH